MAETGDQHREHLRGIDVVVDDGDTQGSCGGSRRLALGPVGCRLLCPRGRQRDFDDRPAADAGAAHLDPPMMHFDQAMCQRQPDSETAGRSLENTSLLVKHLEQARQRVGGNADSGIDHAHHGFVRSDFG